MAFAVHSVPTMRDQLMINALALELSPSLMTIAEIAANLAQLSISSAEMAHTTALRTSF